MQPTDAELVGRCRNGDREAWEIIVRQYHRRVYNLAWRFTARFDDAEDITQEIFFKVYRTLGSYKAGTCSFEAWLLRVARNHLIDDYRRRKTERKHTESLEDPHSAPMEFAGGGESPARSLERRELSERIHRALLELPEEQREAVILRDIEELSYEEIVELLGVPMGTVKSRINRGRIELARLLKKRM